MQRAWKRYEGLRLRRTYRYAAARDAGHGRRWNAEYRGIGDEVKLDLTPLWLKRQTIKGVYAHGVNPVDGRDEHIFETALRFAAQGRVHLREMVTHTFPLNRYQEMIEVNMHKSANRAVKTAVSFT